MDNPKETAQTLQMHEDGLVWLHTGDLGVMDEEGFIYFKQRLKRMIITSGYNVYPSQVENVIDSHPGVLMSTVIGVKDDYKMQRVKAFIVPKPGVEPNDELLQSILDHCAPVSYTHLDVYKRQSRSRRHGCAPGRPPRPDWPSPPALRC